MSNHDSGGAAAQLYGIGTVARLTGISTHTLRIWERRYQVVTAERSESGRRQYSREDIERLTRIKNLIDRGETISAIAGLSLAELKGRLNEHMQVALQRETTAQRVRLAILGDARLAALTGELAPAEVVVVDPVPASFRAEIQRLHPDALLLDLQTLNPDQLNLVMDLRGVSSARRVIVAYSFGRRADAQALEERGVVLLRAPFTPADVTRALFADGFEGQPLDPADVEPLPAPGSPITKIAPRRYSAEQLARLARVSTTVECECPRHLVDLVMSLTAFEVYSAECENRSPEDAALHMHLHATTAHARAMIEDALAHVVRAEGLG